MIGYVTLGVSDIARAQAFYDALLGSVGATRLMEDPEYNGYTMYGTGLADPCLAITRPFDGRPASAGNGTMVALHRPSRAEVDAFHAKALELGGQDEGAPGQRTPTFYGAYVRDLDGNKLCAFVTGPA